MPSATEQGRTGIFFLNDIFSCQGRLVCEQETGQDRSRKSVLWTALVHALSQVMIITLNDYKQFMNSVGPFEEFTHTY